MGVVLGAAFAGRLRLKSESIKTTLNEKSIPRGAPVWLEKMRMGKKFGYQMDWDVDEASERKVEIKRRGGLWERDAAFRDGRGGPTSRARHRGLCRKTRR